MNFKRLLNTPLGKFFVSLLIGLGIATLFRKVCKDKNCITFRGPVLTDFNNKTYKYNDKCYKYTTQATSCDKTKQIIDLDNPPEHIAPELSALSGAKPVASSPSTSLFGIFDKP